METSDVDNIYYESPMNNICRSNVVIQFSKDKQYGLEGTKCQIHVNPTTEDIQFEASQKCVNGVNYYDYNTVKKNNTNEASETKIKNIKDHVVCRLWLYCIGIILIAVGLCLILVGSISNSKGKIKT